MTVNTLKKIISRTADSGLNRSLNGSSTGDNNAHSDREAISIESLNQLIPVRSLKEDELTAFSIGGYAEKFEDSYRLFTENETIDHVLYLLAGSVKIESSSGRGYQISAGSAQSRFPLSTGVKHTTTATTITPVTVLRVSSEVMADSQEIVDSEIMGETTELREIPQELEDSQLFQAIYQNYTQEDLALSILPSVADMVSRGISRDINESQAARIIESDPVITAKLISVANSPLFHGSGTICTALDAINSIGMDATRYVVKNACSKFVMTSANRAYAEQIQDSCVESLLISGLCFALASLTEKVDPKQALTAGLLSNIGIMPFSHYVDKFPSQMYTQDEIDKGWPIVRSFMGTFVLEKLGFPKQISQIPQFADDLFYDFGSEMDLTDIVIISRLQMRINKFSRDNLPDLKTLPSIQKLGGNGLTPELSRLLNQMALKRVKMPLAVVKQTLDLPTQTSSD